MTNIIYLYHKSICIVVDVYSILTGKFNIIICIYEMYTMKEQS